MHTLVFICAFGRNKETYFRIFETIPKNWQLFTLSEEKIVPDGNTEHIIENIENFFEDHHITSCTLAGHSMGGLFAQLYAQKHPKSIQQLILIDSAGIPIKQSFFSLCLGACHVQWYNFIHTKWVCKFLTMEFHNIWQLLMSLSSHYHLISYLQNTNFNQIISSISVPTTIIWGENDTTLPIADGRKLQQLIPNSTLHVIPDENHEWIIYRPEEMWKYLPNPSSKNH